MKRLLLSCLFLSVSLLQGQVGIGLLNDPGEGEFSGKTKVDLLVEPAVAAPGTTVTVGLHMRIPEKWHTYWLNSGDSGEPTKITWKALPPGITAGAIQWPVPEKYATVSETFSDYSYVYYDDLLLIIPLTLSPDLKEGEYQLKGFVEWLECEAQCLPGAQEVTAKLVVGETAKDGPKKALFDTWRAKLPDEQALPALEAYWAETAADKKRQVTERQVTIVVPFGKGAKVAFLPDAFSADEWKVSNDSVQVVEAERTLIRKTITSEQGVWPETFTGVVRVELDGAVQGYRTEVEVKAGKGPVEGMIPKQPVQSIWWILGGAFLGGLILNIMPCVLPVVSMKILGFVQQSQESPERVGKLGLTYALGVWASFLALAGMLISVKNSSAGMASWGMQMQNPIFNLVLLLVVLLVALNLFGVFEVTLGGGTMNKANELSSREGFMGAFFNGVLATALATPCTAPFLAGAMGVALTQGEGTIIAAMSAVALGLASPYVILSFRPDWLKFLPKPGAWMVQFKMLMGFPMLAAAIWILDFTGPMFGDGGVLWLGVLLVFVALAAWVFGEFKQRMASASTKPLVACGVLLLAGYGVAMEWGLDWRDDKDNAISWVAWSPESEQEARESGRPVLIDFTADWCITCKVNKRTSIEIERVRSVLNKMEAVTLIGDYTDRDPRITKILKQYRRAGVPLVLVYGAGQSEPQVLPTILTPQIVLDALEKAGKPSS